MNGTKTEATRNGQVNDQSASRMTDARSTTDEGSRAKEAAEVKGTRKRVTLLSVPLIIVVCLAIFFGIFFWPFGILLGIIAVAMISMKVTYTEATD